MTKELIAYLLIDGCLDEAYDVFALYRSHLSVAVSLRSHELPSGIVRSVSAPASVAAHVVDRQQSAVADAWLFAGRAPASDSSKTVGSDLTSAFLDDQPDEDADTGVDTDTGAAIDRDLTESQLLASVFSVMLFAPAFVRAWHYRGIMLKSSRYARAVGMLEKYSIVFADPLPLPLAELVKVCMCVHMFKKKSLHLKTLADNEFRVCCFTELRLVCRCVACWSQEWIRQSECRGICVRSV